MLDPSPPTYSVTLAIRPETYPLCFTNAIATSAGSTARVGTAAAAAGGGRGADGGVSGSGKGGGTLAIIVYPWCQ